MSVTLYQKVMNTAEENRWRQLGKWFWWFEPFSKLKAAFYEYWTLLKIRISMTCLTKEYEIKTKYWVITWKPLFGGGRSIFGWGDFSRGSWREWANFWLVEGIPPISSVGKTLYAYNLIYLFTDRTFYCYIFFIITLKNSW